MALPKFHTNHVLRLCISSSTSIFQTEFLLRLKNRDDSWIVDSYHCTKRWNARRERPLRFLFSAFRKTGRLVCVVKKLSSPVCYRAWWRLTNMFLFWLSDPTSQSSNTVLWRERSRLPVRKLQTTGVPGSFFSFFLIKKSSDLSWSGERQRNEVAYNKGERVTRGEICNQWNLSRFGYRRQFAVRYFDPFLRLSHLSHFRVLGRVIGDANWLHV